MQIKYLMFDISLIDGEIFKYSYQCFVFNSLNFLIKNSFLSEALLYSSVSKALESFEDERTWFNSREYLETDPSFKEGAGK